MNNTLKSQIELLSKTLEMQVDGVPSKVLPESFSEIVFFKTDKTIDDTTIEKVFIFEDYFVHPYETFDFHTKFNSGNPPPERVMQGVILRETEKMVYISVHTFDNQKTWVGWCPKKSVKLEN